MSQLKTLSLSLMSIQHIRNICLSGTSIVLPERQYRPAIVITPPSPPSLLLTPFDSPPPHSPLDWQSLLPVFGGPQSQQTNGITSQ